MNCRGTFMESSERVKVIFEPISKRIFVNKGTTIITALKTLGLVIESPCGGLGTCGKCKIICQENKTGLSELSKNELKLLTKHELEQGYRLACQCNALDDIRIVLPEASFGKNAKILYDSKANRNVFHQRYFECELLIQEASIEHPETHYNRVISSFKVQQKVNSDNAQIRLDLEDLRDLSIILKDSNRLWVKYKKIADDSFEILKIHNGTTKGIYGLAIDLGTTTMVGYLYDMITGEMVGQHAILNPQVEVGEDVVTRLTAIAQNNSLEHLSGLAKKGINSIILNICNTNRIDPSLIFEVDIVGNTAMHHIFYGFETYKLAVSPYIPVFKDELIVPNHFQGLNINNKGIIYSPPVIAGYVGADTVACIESTQFTDISDYTMMIDIGTNGEIVIGNKEVGMFSGSVAAGSALEGAHISSGMRAAAGSIEKITIDPNSLEPKIQIIGTENPVGICGSGIIDIVAELLKRKIITRSGRFNVSSETIMNNQRIEKQGTNISYIVHSPKHPAIDAKTGTAIETKDDRIIRFSQQDVREFQKAKGAFLSGAYLINAQIDSSLRKESFDQLLIAGAFGSYINAENARFVGLIPDIELDKIIQIGNASGLGAQNMLINEDRKRYSREAAWKVTHVQIALIESFQKHYAECMTFPHKDLKHFESVAEDYKDIPIR
mgnify:CR=1 FL=1